MADLPVPDTRLEKQLAAMSGVEVELPEPLTRAELILASKLGMDVEAPTPTTRLEQFLAALPERGDTPEPPTPTPTAPEKDVNFYDYDGTVLHSYTAAEFASLAELPENPSHAGLTAQGWNWSLAKAKAYVAKYGMLDIGQMYITDDGKTRLYITIEDLTRPNVIIYFQASVNGGVEINWGDGSETELSSETSARTYSHDYAQTGDYIITLTVLSGTLTLTGASGSTGNCIMGDKLKAFNTTRLRAVELGTNVSVESYVFYDCRALTSITIPDGVTSIGGYAFNNCYALTSITIPDGVTSIGNVVFFNCRALTSITIPDGVTSIESNAFQGCYALTSITIPDGVTSIGGYAFNNCYALTSITIPDGVTSIGGYAFYGCYALTSITIPDGVTSIGSDAFRYCRALTSITIPDEVTSIESNAFSSCYALTSITIPDGVTSIWSNAFNSCYALTSITIPDGVTSIESNAFPYCYSMLEYHLLPTIPPTLANTNAFTSIPSDCVIYVPAESLEAYQTATNWATYASYMRGE